MKLTVLNSGSRANGYVLQNDTCALIIEAGVKWSDCLDALGYNVAKAAACIVTHEHKDHCKYIDQYLLAPIPVYCSQGTADAINTQIARKPLTLKPLTRVTLGEFQVMAFDTQHDSKEPFGFLIYHKDMGTLLFATDTYYLKYKFEGLTQIMLEANYADDILQRNIDLGVIPRCVRNRTLQSHMSLDQVIKTLQANNLQAVRNIILLHLSHQNGDKERFKKEVEMAIGKKVTIAEKGVEVNLSKSTF